MDTNPTATTERRQSRAPRGDMDALIASFPCLRRKGAPKWTDDSGDWQLWIETGCLSSGEFVTATFILHVWNWQANAKHPIESMRFSIGRAMNAWDDGNRAAFLNWASDPWYA